MRTIIRTENDLIQCRLSLEKNVKPMFEHRYIIIHTPIDKIKFLYYYWSRSSETEFTIEKFHG